MDSSPSGYISTDVFVRELESINRTFLFDMDHIERTWQVSWIRFVRSSIEEFDSLVQFAAMAIHTSQHDCDDKLNWARNVVFFPIPVDRYEQDIEIARSDFTSVQSQKGSAPEWLAFDSPVLEAFEIGERGGPLINMADHSIYRTAAFYYYLALNRES